MPTRVTGTEPVSEFDDGVPARPTPAPSSARGMATCQYAELSVQRSSMPTKASASSTWPIRSVARDPLACTRAADRGATSTIRKTAGRMAMPASRLE
jgi:hypothetical protein